LLTEKNVIEQFQTHGVIKEIGENGIIKIERTNLSLFTLPFDEVSITEAKEGIYRERSTGTEIENPKFLTSWTVDYSKLEHLKDNKLYSFQGFVKEIDV
jgi:hypothetical protein